MRKSRRTNKKKEVALVHCCYCEKFERDTEGRSVSVDTGEYFMGICLAGSRPDTPKKQLANKPRECPLFEKVFSKSSTE